MGALQKKGGDLQEIFCRGTLPFLNESGVLHYSDLIFLLQTAPSRRELAI